jgi:hypothetical protein
VENKESKSMNLLFVDIDGVIINRKSSKISYDNPDPNCVARLNQLIEQSGAKIVVTGAWRISRGVNELQQLLDRWNVRGAVIARTPSGPGGCKRGDEIDKFFLEWQGEEIESFVILDDDADFGQSLPHLVHTRFESGLTINDAEMAMKIFERYKKRDGSSALAT